MKKLKNILSEGDMVARIYNTILHSTTDLRTAKAYVSDKDIKAKIDKYINDIEETAEDYYKRASNK